MYVFVVPGHRPTAVGACHEGFCEFPETLKWSELLQQDLRRVGIPSTLVSPGTLSNQIATINTSAANKAEPIVLSIHFNSGGNGTVSGCETLYCPGSKDGERLAKHLQHRLVLAMENRDRGVKEGWYRMDRPGVVDYAGDVDGDEQLDALLKSTVCPAVIVEPEFIQQVDTIRDKRVDAVAAMVHAIQAYYAGREPEKATHGGGGRLGRMFRSE